MQRAHFEQASDFGAQAEFAPQGAELGGVFFVNGAIGPAGLGFNAYAAWADDVVDQGAQNATANVAVALQVAGLGAHGGGTEADDGVGAVGVGGKFAHAAGLGRFVRLACGGHLVEYAARTKALQPGGGAEVADDAVNEVDGLRLVGGGGLAHGVMCCGRVVVSC